MHDTLLLVQVPDALRHLEDDVARELLGEVGELDDLVEELAAGHEPVRRDKNARRSCQMRRKIQWHGKTG